MEKDSTSITSKKRPLIERVHEALNRLGIHYNDICLQTNIDAESFVLWSNQDAAYDYTHIEEALEEWLDSKVLRGNEEKSYFQIRSQYLKRLDVGQQTASKWIESSEQDKLPANESAKAEHLLPIALDIDIEGQQFKENIVWNYFEPYLSPECFARQLARENRLGVPVEQEIVNAIRRALSNYRFYEPKESELLRTIELNILIDNVQLKDRFEWDIHDSSNSPESFAMNMCAELGLNNEFAQRIAYQIREQIQNSQKLILERRITPVNVNVKKSTRSLIESSAVFTNIDPKHFNVKNITLENYLRPLVAESESDASSWEPKILILTPEEIRRVQKEEQRSQRLLRRAR